MKSLAIIFLILISGLRMSAQQANCWNLLEAVRDGDSQQLLSLLDTVDPNCSSSGDGTALIIAASTGKIEMAKILLKQGADVNRESEGDGNPLIAAAKSGHLHMVKLLIKSGAEIDTHVEGDETALIQAAWNGQLEVVKYLVEQGADVNKAVRDRYALRSELRSPLKMAKRKRHKEVVAFLIDAGATH